MDEDDGILRLLERTRESEIIKAVDESYKRIEGEQKDWYEASSFYCPSGCGHCCVNFEPDLLECEAIYMAYWLIKNQYETAIKITQGEWPFYNGSTCPFFNRDKGYHCSIYGGRPFICRLFGASSAYGKNGGKVWKPCRFIPLNNLKEYDPILEHREYDEESAAKILKKLPPAMSDMMESALLLSPDSEETKLIREILPLTIGRLLWLLKLNGAPDNNPNGAAPAA